MEKSKARIALEGYFAAKSDVETQRASGNLDDLHYMLKANHLVRLLSDKSEVAFRAMDTAISMLGERPALAYSEIEKLQKLSSIDIHRYVGWTKDLTSRNLEQTSYRLLEVMEGIDYPPVPAPSQTAVDRHVSSYYNRMGLRSPNRDEAQHDKPTPILIDCSDKKGTNG